MKTMIIKAILLILFIFMAICMIVCFSILTLTLIIDFVQTLQDLFKNNKNESEEKSNEKIDN